MLFEGECICFECWKGCLKVHLVMVKSSHKMKNLKRLEKACLPIFSVLLLFIIGCNGGKNTSGRSDMKIGLGEIVITPANPVGVPMGGYDRGANTSEGVHDDLYARCIVAEDRDENAVALVTIAIVNLREAVIDSIRSGVEKETGIPFGNVAVSCTHTHSGPADGAPSTEYSKYLIKKCVDMVSSAWKDRFPGKIGVGKTELYTLAMNDRRMEFGGAISDPGVGVIKIEDDEEKLRGVFFNFGCHPSTLDLHNLLFTEDWPYYSIKGIKEKVGEDVITGYFQSAQGDAKIGYSAELSAVGVDMNGIRTYENAERKGRLMTDAVLELLPSIKAEGSLDVRAVYDHFDFPRRTTYPYTYQESLQMVKDASEKVERYKKLLGVKVGQRMLDKAREELWLANQFKRYSKIIEENKDTSPIKMPMQAIRIGENVFVTFPSEVFTEIGLKVKQQSPYENTLILGVAGRFGGYLPTKEEYLEQGYASNGSPFAPGADDVMIDAARQLIKSVSTDDKLPENLNKPKLN